MNVQKMDLNLLVYLDVLLDECSVTRAAERLGITQPAMSNSLRRLRDWFDDPLLVRTSEGMQPTQRAQQIKPSIRDALTMLEKTVQPAEGFDCITSDRVFRIMASDYGEATLLPRLCDHLHKIAPNISLDIMTPSDVSIRDLEQGKVDMAINRFSNLPDAFYQKALWYDNFVCLMHKDNPLAEDFSFESYLNAYHIWVSKTGIGKGMGMNPREFQRLGRVDDSLAQMGKERKISVFTRHYQVAGLLASQTHLVATIPKKLAKVYADSPLFVIRQVPFAIPPFELKMVWSPLLHYSPDHRWLREQLTTVAEGEGYA
jgi:DNA-binding transcriptional LysR family regulator